MADFILRSINILRPLINMKKFIRTVTALVTCVAIFVPSVAKAQKSRRARKGEIYFSWGYNTEWYTRSNLRISQPELGNNYTFTNIKGHDNKGWDGRINGIPSSTNTFVWLAEAIDYKGNPMTRKGVVTIIQ